MYVIHSTGIEGKEGRFGTLRDLFSQHRFTLGGNWDYHKGSFDSLLHREGEEDIYLRIPFAVTEGELEEEEARIRFGSPYVLKHVVQTGTEPNTQLANAVVNQFQQPQDPDAELEPVWAERAAAVVKEIVAKVEEPDRTSV